MVQDLPPLSQTSSLSISTYLSVHTQAASSSESWGFIAIVVFLFLFILNVPFCIQEKERQTKGFE